MMRLSTMGKVDATLDAMGSSPVVERILEQWAHDAGSVRFFRSSANFLYLFTQAGKRYFLRFADSAERERAAIEAEVDLVNWLAAAGLTVATPVRSRQGNYVETVATEVGLFHAVVFAEVQGRQFEVEELDEAGFRAWGAALGEVHTTVKSYAGPAISARKTWRDHLAFASHYIPADAPALQREWQQISAALEALPADRESFGLIHFDFELDNLVWDEQRIGILDFDDCALEWFAADIAFALRDLFAHAPNLHDPSFRAFVQGYRSYCPLDETAIATIPLFLRMAKLYQYARIARSLDLSPHQLYPNWLVGLSDKLQKRIQDYRISLESRSR